MDNSVHLVLDDTITRVSPDNIMRVLGANQDVADVKVVDCSAKELLDFILEIQKIAVDAHVTSLAGVSEGVNP